MHFRNQQILYRASSIILSLWDKGACLDCPPYAFHGRVSCDERKILRTYEAKIMRTALMGVDVELFLSFVRTRIGQQEFHIPEVTEQFVGSWGECMMVDDFLEHLKKFLEESEKDTD